MGHETVSPSNWVRRWAGVLAPGSYVLDLASGAGRHARYLLGLGHRVLAVDLDVSDMSDLHERVEFHAMKADLENAPWPFDPEIFDGIVVTNYLHRPLFPHTFASLRPGGVLIYETFAVGNGEYGRPSNPEFLLKPGELLEVAMGRARVIAFEDGYIDRPKPAVVQRICAVKNGAPVRHFPVSGN
jgi:SAM-dependent methyltransferase